MDELRELIRKKAGLSASAPFVDNFSSPFGRVMLALADVKQAKELEYGDYVAKQKLVKPLRMAMFDHFVNIRRKFVRAEHIVNRIVDRETGTDDLIDTYADMAVYCILGIQLAYARRGEK